MSNLVTRALSGSLYVLLVISCIFFLENGSWYLALVLGIPALLEWHSFKPASHTQRQTVFSILLLLAGLASIHPLISLQWEGRMLFLSLAFTLFLGLDSMFREDQEEQNLDSLFRNIFGIVYILGPLLSMVALGAYNPWVLAGIFILIWCFDSFAYLVGKYLGSHKMMPRISPKKTWEGFIGGTIFAGGAAALIWNYTSGGDVLTLEQWLLLAVLVVASATLGDLFESALKRKHGIKDSGNMMPGHGGILDRIDSLLFAMPVSFLFLNLIATELL